MTFPEPPESAEVATSDGVRLHVARYRPSGPVKARVVATHGIQSHAAWFDATSRQLAAAGYDVWFADRRGSGRSGGERGHARGAERLVRDYADVAAAAGGPVVAWGVCWGGKVAAAFAATGRADALVLLYPGLFPRLGPTLRQRAMLRLAGAVGIQARRVPLPLTADLFTNSAGWRAAMDADELSVREASVGLLRAGVGLEAMSSPGPIRCPTRLVLCGGDRVIHNARTRRWLAGVAGPAEGETVPGARHVLEFDAAREAVAARTVAWLDRLFAGV